MRYLVPIRNVKGDENGRQQIPVCVYIHACDWISYSCGLELQDGSRGYAHWFDRRSRSWAQLLGSGCVNRNNRRWLHWLLPVDNTRAVLVSCHNDHLLLADWMCTLVDLCTNSAGTVITNKVRTLSGLRTFIFSSGLFCKLIP